MLPVAALPAGRSHKRQQGELAACAGIFDSKVGVRDASIARG